MKRRKRKRWLRRIAAGTLVAACLAAGGLWLGLRHVPGWYRPVDVPDEQLQRVRNDLADKFREVSDRMVAGRSFEVTFTDRVVSEWIAARGQIWPDSQEWIPPWLTGPVVAFVPGEIVLAAHLNRDGWEGIVGLHFRIELDGQVVVLRLAGVTWGAVPVPLRVLAGSVSGLIRSERLDPEAMPDELARLVRKLRRVEVTEFLDEGVRMDGPLVWKNGDRPYRILDVRVEPGRATLRIQPL